MRNLIRLAFVTIGVALVFGATIQNFQFDKAPNLSCIMNPFTGEPSQRFNVSEGSLGPISLSKPATQTKPTSIMSANYLLPSSCLNNSELAEFFGLSSSNQGYASMINHFNCRGEGPTCETFKIETPISGGVCILIANVDENDKLTVTAVNNGRELVNAPWDLVAFGLMDPNGTHCGQMDMLQTKQFLQVGCYGDKCSNPNYSIYRLPSKVDNITFCYESHSDHGMVSYTVTSCPDHQKPTPVAGTKFAVSGTAFVDKLANGMYDIGVDQPLYAIPVTIYNNFTGERAIDAFNNVVQDVYTDSNGYYLFEGLTSGVYNVKFNFPSNSVTTTLNTNVGSIKTSKITPDFRSIRFSLVSSQTSPVAPNEIDDASYTTRILRDINGGIL